MACNTLYVLDATGDYRVADSTTLIAAAKRRIAVKCRRGMALSPPDAEGGVA